MRDKIIEKIEVLRKTILNDKNVNVLDKGLYCFELCEIRLEIEELELKPDLLHDVSESLIELRQIVAEKTIELLSLNKNNQHTYNLKKEIEFAINSINAIR
tara:strand:- start:2275 stop:2577 length:303 start_codon:yes stop_codon:yes gene_type:complete